MRKLILLLILPLLASCYGYRYVGFEAPADYRVEDTRIIYDNGLYRNFFWEDGVYSYGAWNRWYGGDFYNPIFYNNLGIYNTVPILNVRTTPRVRTSRTVRIPNRRNTPRVTRPVTRSRNNNAVRNRSTRSTVRRVTPRPTIRRTTSSSGRRSTTRRN